MFTIRNFHLFGRKRRKALRDSYREAIRELTITPTPYEREKARKAREERREVVAMPRKAERGVAGRAGERKLAA